MAYPSGVQNVAPPLVGTEKVAIVNAGAVSAQTTTAAIGALGATQGVASLKLNGATSGTTTLQPSAIAGTTTQTLPAVSGVVASTTGTNLFVVDIYRSTTIQTANANVVPATVTGLVAAVVVGTYKYRLVLYTTIASGTGGLAVTGLLTTAVLGVGNLVTVANLAASSATTATTTVTSPLAFYSTAAVPLQVVSEGTFTVTTAGTLTIQMCQAVSNASDSSVNVGSTLELIRIV